MQLTELHVSPQWSVCLHSFLEICNGILLSAMQLTVTKGNPQIRRWKKLSENLLSEVWLHLSELHHYFLEPFPRTVSVVSEKWYFRWVWRVEGQGKYPPRKTRMKFSEKLLCDVWIHFTVLYPPFMGDFPSTHFVESHKWWISLNPMVNKELFSDKPVEKPSQKRLYCGWIQPTEFRHCFHWEAC